MDTYQPDPLLRRVQRHLRVATLFRAPGERARLRPSSLSLASLEVAPVEAVSPPAAETWDAPPNPAQAAPAGRQPEAAPILSAATPARPASAIHGLPETATPRPAVARLGHVLAENSPAGLPAAAAQSGPAMPAAPLAEATRRRTGPSSTAVVPAQAPAHPILARAIPAAGRAATGQDMPGVQRQAAPAAAATTAPLSSTAGSPPKSAGSSPESERGVSDRDWKRLEAIFHAHTRVEAEEESAPAAPVPLQQVSADEPAPVPPPAVSEYTHSAAPTVQRQVAEHSGAPEVTIPVSGGERKTNLGSGSAEAGSAEHIVPHPPGAARPPLNPLPLEAVWPVERIEAPEMDRPRQVLHGDAEAAPYRASRVETQSETPARPAASWEGGAAHEPLLGTPPAFSLPQPAATPAIQRLSDPAAPAPAAGEGWIETDMGPLPADLWGLIDEPVPIKTPAAAQSGLRVAAPLAQPAAAPAVRPTSPAGPAFGSGIIQRQVEAGGEASPPAAGGGTGTPAPGQEPAPGPNVEDLARQVYAGLRRQLAVEVERSRGRL